MTLKGVSHPLPSGRMVSCNTQKVLRTFLIRLSISFASPKRNGRKKRAPLRGACRDRTIAHFFEMSAIVCAKEVSAFSGLLRFFFYHSFILKCFLHFGFFD
jgi:hypothetical protein